MAHRIRRRIVFVGSKFTSKRYKMKKIFLVGVMLTICTAAESGEDGGWQLAGFSEAPHAVAVFFLASEIKREPTGNVQVWTKALSLSRLQHVYDVKGKDQTFINRVAKKVAAYYVPSIALVKTITADQSIEVIAFEDIANDQDTITPEVRILWEIDCAQSIYRTMSIVTKTGRSSSGPGGWEPVPPELSSSSSQKAYLQHLIGCDR